MRNIIAVLLLFFISGTAFADRNAATVTTYKASALVKTGDAKVYSAQFTASAAGGYFNILNAVSSTSTGSGATVNDIKAEGSEATSLNSKFYDFNNKPLEFSTGLYVVVSNGFLTISYE